jgi:multidrug efflux system membrane fusion protein
LNWKLEINMAFNRKRLYVALAAALAVGAAGVLTLHTRHNLLVKDAEAATEKAQPAATVVDVAQVAASTITDYQEYSGHVEAIEHVDVRPQVPGTIVAVHFKDGALVHKGDSLFTIDPRPYVAAVDKAEAQLAAAQAQQGYTSTDAARAERLLADNAIAKRDYDEAQNAAREAVANVKGAQAALESARIDLGYTNVTAPVDGRVSRAELTVGNVVSIGANAPVLTSLVSVNPIYASFDVDEQTYLRYLARDTKGNVPVELGLADETGYSRKGVVVTVDNQLNTSSGTIRVRGRFDNTDGVLLPGLYARVKVGGGAPHAAVMVDEAAIGTDQAKKYVLVVDSQNRVQYREVKLGVEHENLRVVESGLKAGELIVVNGTQRVKAGDAVQPNIVKMDATSSQKSDS